MEEMSKEVKETIVSAVDAAASTVNAVIKVEELL